MAQMTNVWILVANASTASLYQSPKARLINGNAELTKIREFNHPASRQKNGELLSDKVGNYQGRHNGQSTYDQPMDAKQIEAQRFARELASELEQGLHSRIFQELIIAAPPQFHGVLNQTLDRHVPINVNIEKDYTRDNEGELLKHLQPFL